MTVMVVQNEGSVDYASITSVSKKGKQHSFVQTRQSTIINKTVQNVKKDLMQCIAILV